jgi:hypothetical protein
VDYLLRFTPRWVRVVIVLQLAFAFIVTSSRMIGSVVPNNSTGCLQYEDWRGIRKVVDLAQLASLSQQYVTQEDSLNQPLTAVSPDKRFTAFTEHDTKGTLRLVVQPTDGGSANIVRRGIISGTTDKRDLAWSPDSVFLAYRWQQTTNAEPYLATSYYLSITDRSGQKHKTVRIPAHSEDTVSLHGWSSDGRYVAVSVFDVSLERHDIIILSAADLTLIYRAIHKNSLKPSASAPFDYYGRFDRVIVRWGARGDWLAYLISGSEGVRLTLLSPTIGTKRVYSLHKVAHNTVTLLWSPDGKHVAVAGISDFEKPGYPWWLSVFSIDGTAYPIITDKLSNMMTIAGGTIVWPMMVWSTDGQTLWYSQQRAVPSDDRGHLMAFRPGQSPPIVLQSNIFLNFHTTHDNRYLSLKWEDKNGNRVLAVDTNTMDRIDLDDNAPGFGMELVEPQWSSDSKWLVLQQLNVWLWAVNVETGTRHDLQQHQGYDRAVASNDTRFVSSLSEQNGEFIFHLTDLDREITHHIRFDSQRPDLFNMSVSPDGKLVVGANWGNGRLNIFTSDGSIARHFKGSPTGIYDLALIRCN